MRPRRGRALTVAIAGGLVLGSRLVEAVEVAVLKIAAPRTWRVVVDALEEGARAHRLTEYELPPHRAQAQQAVAGLRGRAAVLVALGSAAAEAARAGLPDMPLVFCMVPDPAGSGLVPAPAPHVSGVAFEVPVRNQLAALRLVNPRAVRIGVLYSPAHTARYAEEAEQAAAVLRLVVTTRAVESTGEVPAALRALLAGASAVDALWLPPDPVLLAAETRRHLFAEMLGAGKAVYSHSPDLLEEGALASHGPDLASIGQEVAALVDRLAAGERGIPLRAPRAELAVNLRLAGRLGIEIPETTLDTARKH
ncbi:MAG TPA: ABC transporter substrate binding protein [Vicinamibacteria bacterium]|nr:ABC transporter substrate binding protein [Vicinamibacteria bacterium]